MKKFIIILTLAAFACSPMITASAQAAGKGKAKHHHKAHHKHHKKHGKKA